MPFCTEGSRLNVLYGKPTFTLVGLDPRGPLQGVAHPRPVDPRPPRRVLLPGWTLGHSKSGLAKKHI